MNQSKKVWPEKEYRIKTIKVDHREFGDLDDLRDYIDKHPELTRSGDMLAHYACVINKMKKAGYEFPATRGKRLKDYLDKMRATDQKVKGFHEICNKAGEIGESDPDYPDPPMCRYDL